MPVYVVTAPDGNEYEVTAPEGATEQQVLEYAKKNYSSLGKKSSAPTTENESAAETKRLAGKKEVKSKPSLMQQMFGPGSPTYSVVRGAVIQPALGINELLSKAFPEPVRKGASNLVRQEAQAYERGREQQGREGFDMYQLGGAVLSPANKLLTGAQAPTALARVGQGAAAGAVFGGLTPTSGNEDTFVSEKLLQMGLGGVIGGTVPLTTETSKKIIKIIKDLPLTEAAKQRALQKYVVGLAGDKPEIAATALRQADELVAGSKPTAAEALAETPSAARLVREQGRLAQEFPERFITRSQEQQAARQTELAKTFGTEDDLTKAIAERTKVTSPMREDALRYADVYGKTAPKLQAVIDKANTDLSKFQPRGIDGEFTSGRTKAINEYITKNRDFKQAQLDSLNENGFYPLTVAPLVQRIDDSMSKVGERSNELLQTAQASLRNKLLRFSDKNGIIPSNDLYNIRKEIGEDIQKFLTDRGNPSFGAQATAVEKTLKAQLDEAITKASGSTLWKEYLTNFAKHSEKIDQMRVGQELAKKLGGTFDKEAAGRFATGIQSAPSLIKRTTGQQRFDKLEDFLTTDQMSSVNRVYADLTRKSKAEQVSSKVKVTGKVPFEGEEQLPQTLSRWATIGRSVLDTLRRGSQKELDNKVADLMLEPQKLAAFLEGLPKKDAKNIGTAIAAKLSPKVRDEFLIMLQTPVPTQGEIVRGATQTMMTQ